MLTKQRKPAGFLALLAATTLALSGCSQGLWNNIYAMQDQNNGVEYENYQETYTMTCASGGYVRIVENVYNNSRYLRIRNYASSRVRVELDWVGGSDESWVLEPNEMVESSAYHVQFNWEAELYCGV